MSAYVTEADVASFGHEFDSLGSGGAVALLLDAASRFFDRECGVEDDFFAPAGDTATDRTFYGDGTAYLKLPPFLSSPAPVIDIPGSEYSVTANDYDVINGHLVWLSRVSGRRYETFEGLNRYTGWYDGVAVTVTAKWGWESVPADVQMAVIAIAWAMRRTMDPAFERISGGDGKPSPITLPATAQSTVDKYRMLYNARAAFA